MDWPGKIRRAWDWSRTENGAGSWLTAGAVIIIGAIWFSWVQPASRQAQMAATRIAVAVAQDTARNFEQLDLTLQAIIGGRQTPADASLTEEERNAILSERAPRDRYVDFIDVLGPDGSVLASTRPAPILSNWANQLYFTAQQKSSSNAPVIGHPYSIMEEGKAGVTISHRINDRDGRFLGVAVAGLRLSYFRDLFASLELDPQDSVTLLTDEGFILMRMPLGLNDVGRRVGELIPFASFVRTGASVVTARDPGDGIRRLFVFRKVGSLPLTVSVGIAAPGISVWWFVWPAIAALGVAVGFLVRWIRRRFRQAALAEQENREKSQFLTMLSHELRTPLHGVLGYADQLAHDPDLNGSQSHRAAEIVRAAKHMRDVVNVVLDYSRIEAFCPPPHMRRTDIRELLEGCLAVIKPSALVRGLELQLVLDPKLPSHVVTDDVQLRQILMNLLTNAVKYTPRGTVALRVEGKEDRLIIEVADTGVGIPEGKRHLLFKEFERFGAERTSIEGTGLGLAIAHRLALRMGGHIGYRENPDGGSIFWLELPAGTAEEPDECISVNRAEPERPLKVLVVDDSEINRAVTSSFLRNAGHSAVEAHDGRQAIALASSQDFQVVLMDMRMAEMDGLEAARRIRALDGPRGQVPIVAVTANALDQHVEECLRAGMSEHLAKPFTQDELIAALRRAVANHPPKSPGDEPVVDADNLAQLTACTGKAGLQSLLDTLAVRVEAFLRATQGQPERGSGDAIAELAHELIGSAGTLGFLRLASAAGRYEVALAADFRADAAEARTEAVAVLAELRRRQAGEAVLAD